VAGEIFIAGANVGRGYRNRPKLTRERFIANPFAPQTMMYRTGDLGRRSPDGQIAFLGRVDDQIKIRGYRIEPAEIAAAMNAHTSVIASTVTASAAAGDDRHLIGYVVRDGDLSRSQMQAFLRDRLPDYMVPSVFVVLEALPVTANGKVDYQVLPLPAPHNTLRDETTAANSKMEESVAQIVSGLLRVPEVGADDDFFLIGGHSLLGTQLIARIHEVFGVEVPLRTLFEQPTVRSLAVVIEYLLAASAEETSNDPAQLPSCAAVDSSSVEPVAAVLHPASLSSAH
jgi:acyl carrier protein